MSGIFGRNLPWQGRLPTDGEVLRPIAKLDKKFRRLARVDNFLKFCDESKQRKAILACGKDWQQAIALLRGIGEGLVQLHVLGFNAAMRTCEKAGHWKIAVDLSMQMQYAGIRPNKFAGDILVKAAGISGWRLAVEKLATMCDCEEDSEAPDHVSFNCAISACKREDNDAWHAAVTLFTGLFKRSVQPSHVTYSASSSVYASAAVWTVSMSLLEHLNCQGKFRGTDVDLSDFSNDPRLDPRSVTVLKLAYAKEQPRHARRIDSRTVNPWAPTVNQAVVSCAQVSVWQPALLAVAGAKRYGLFSPKIETYNSMATACLRCHAWSWGLLLLGEAQRNGLRVDAVSAAAAFSSCQTEQQWKVTSKILQHLRIGEEEGVPADLYTTSAAMTSLEKGDRWQDAMELFISSTLARLSHNVVSFSAAITSCEAGQWWRGAFALLQRMREAGLRPNAFSYQAALSSTRENWRQGLSFFDSMQLAGIKWTVLGCQDLICACSHGGQAGFVRRLLRLVRQKKDWATGRLKGHSHGHSGHSCCGKPMGGVRTLKTFT